MAEVEVEIGAYFTTITDQTEATTAAMAGAFGMEPAMVASHMHFLIGSVDEIAETLLARRDAYDISYVTVGAASMKAFAPVVAKLAGN